MTVISDSNHEILSIQIDLQFKQYSHCKIINNFENMSDNGSNNNTTSFASILAGVQKLRDASNVDVIISNSNENNNNSKLPRDANNNSNNINQKNNNIANNITRLNNLAPSNKVDRNESLNGFRSASTMINRAPSLGPKKRQISDNSSTKDVNENEIKSFNKTSLYQSRLPKSKKPVISKITIHPSQKGNPLIKSLKNVPYEYTSILKTDYLINGHISVLFLSLKYHKLRPEYIYERIRKAMGSKVSDSSSSSVANNIDSIKSISSINNLQVLLLLLDTPTNYWDSLEEITKICISNGITLLIAWSFEEAGEYVTMLKKLDSVPNSRIQNNRGGSDKFDIIKGIQKQDYYSRLLGTLTSVKSINKTDVKKAASSGVFTNFKELIEDNGARLQLIDGFGSVKIQRYKNTINEPFIYNYEDHQDDPEVIEWKEKCRNVKLDRLNNDKL